MMLATLAAGLLATAAALLMIETRAARASAGDIQRLIQAQLRSEALLAHAVAALDGGEPAPWRGVIFEDDDARVWRQDAAGLVDLNSASPELLAAFFAGLGASPDQARAFADRIGDWRDEDDLKRLRGAERPEYEERGLPAPANRPFETEGELVAVLGVDHALVSCAGRYLTVYSGEADIDAAAAPDDLLTLLGRTREERIAGGAPMGRIMALTAEAPLSDHAIMRRTLWLRLTGDPNRPVLVHRAHQELAPRQIVHRPCEARFDG